MKRSFPLFLCVMLALMATAHEGYTEEIDDIFKKVKELAAAENYPKAIEELGWAQKELEKKHFAKLETLLPDEIDGFKGQKAKATSAMGFTSVERTYKKGSESIKLSITGGSLGGGAGGAGGLAALGRMGAMMGNQPGVDTYRLDGKTANLKVQNNRGELNVFLDSGSVLKLEQRKVKDDGKTLKAVAEAIKVGELDSYLKGSGGKTS